MTATGIVFFMILFIIEFRVFSLIFYSISNASLSGSIRIDDDVKEEETRVVAMTVEDLQENNLVLQKITKSYGKLLAVNQVSVAVQR